MKNLEKAITILGQVEDESDTVGEFEPGEDDGFVEDKPMHGYSVSLGGKWLGEADSLEEAGEMLVVQMEKERVWPNTWFVSDHGNISPFVIEQTAFDVLVRNL